MSKCCAGRWKPINYEDVFLAVFCLRKAPVQKHGVTTDNRNRSQSANEVNLLGAYRLGRRSSPCMERLLRYRRTITCWQRCKLLVEKRQPMIIVNN